MECGPVSDVRRLSEPDLGPYLESVGIIPRNSSVVVTRAGDGNINWVRRVVAGNQAWIVKQARPALEAFPEYAVSTERIVFEARYFEVARPFDRDGILPRIEHFDPEARVLVLEDLTQATRLDAAIVAGRDFSAALSRLTAFLGRVHAGTGRPELASRFENSEMRRLHGDHIFSLPFRENDFPLTPAVAERGLQVRADATLVATIDAAFVRYLESNACLVHADVQPTNVLLTPNAAKLLDAEIAHLGDPAFDIGVLLAHLRIAEIAHPTSASTLAAVWSSYASQFDEASFAAAARYAGIEMLRRTLGAARVPAVSDDAVALAVIDAGSDWITSPPARPAPVG